MYPKPKKRKQKSRHRTNNPCEKDLCDICHSSRPSQKHEWFHDGNSNTRNYCIEAGWQHELCAYCHDKIHRNRRLDLELMNDKLNDILAKNEWTLDDFRMETGITIDFDGNKLGRS